MNEPFLLGNYERYDLTIERGAGCYVFDEGGQKYLDMIAGIGVNAFGYSHPRVTAAIVEQASRSVHTSNLVRHQYQAPLAEKLCRASGLDRAFFSNSGTEAMEAAIKCVRARSVPGKSRIVALHGSFHGRTLGSLALTGQPDLRRNFVFPGAAITFVEPNDLPALQAAIGEDTVAVVVEPVLGEGGIVPLTEEFLRAAEQWAHAAGAWLVCDEVQCGLGRTGRFFAYQWPGIQPDLVVTAKPLAAGLPLGATLFTGEAARWLPPHSHGTTFGGGPLACRVALEVVEMVEESLPRIQQAAAIFREKLNTLARRHTIIREVRSKGLMFGIELTLPGGPIVAAAIQKGLLMNCTQGNVLRLLPPYIVSDREIDEAVWILDRVLATSAQ